MREEFWKQRAEFLSQFSGSGLTLKEVARRSGLCPQTVRKYATLFGLEVGVEKDAESQTLPAVSDRIDALRELAASGKSRMEAAAELGLLQSTVHYYVYRYGIEFVHGGIGNGVDMKRAEAMASMYRSGKTLAEIGSLYGITRERVRQILKKRQGMTAGDGGIHAKSKRNRAARLASKDIRYFEKYGCSFAQYRELAAMGKPTRAWHSQRQNAIRRGIDWNLTLWEWWQIWQQSGKWDVRGRTKDEYVMCRFGDNGAYEAGNVYIATASHNMSVQPNNPYRKDHPRHAEVMADVRRKPSSRNGKTYKRKYPDLPVGVTINNNRYQAQIGISGKSKYLGTFGTPEEAHAAYLRKLAELDEVAA